jgi:hypothetical protein
MTDAALLALKSAMRTISSGISRRRCEFRPRSMVSDGIPVRQESYCRSKSFDRVRTNFT